MIKNSHNIPNITRHLNQKSDSQASNHIEHLIQRLCSKIASTNNLNERSKEEFLNSSYAYVVKIFCSDAYSPVYETFEVSQKIKKKRNFHPFFFSF